MAFVLLVPVSQAFAQAPTVTIDDLQGVTIHATVNSSGVFRNDHGTAPADVTLRNQIKIGPGDAIHFEAVRSVAAHGPKGTKTGNLRRSSSGTIGLPSEAKDKSGSGVWILENDTLVLLKTFEVGGLALRIALKKDGGAMTCVATSSVMRELGAGDTKDRAAMEGGGRVVVLSMKQTGSSCRVVKP